MNNNIKKIIKKNGFSIFSELTDKNSGSKKIYILKKHGIKYIAKYSGNTRIIKLAIKDVYKKLQIINDESIISIKDIIDYKNGFFIIVRYADGINFNQYIKNIYYCEKDAGMEKMKKIFMGIAILIDKLHSYNIVHGDVSGANIIIGEYLKVNIIDFDFSISFDENIRGCKKMDIYRYNTLLLEVIFEQIYLNERYKVFIDDDIKEKKEFFNLLLIGNNKKNEHTSCIDVFESIFGLVKL